MINLLCMKHNRVVKARNLDGFLRKGLPRIFLCNEHEHPFGYDAAKGGHASVTSRFNLIDITLRSELVDDGTN